ncbi:MAG: endolytic transglycosylase MltG [Oscillospiraceae bacterium]
MDNNRSEFDENELSSVSDTDEENIGSTQQLDSLPGEFGSEEKPITPREEFTENNSAEESGSTRLMDSVGGDDVPPHIVNNPVKKRRKSKKKKQVNHTRTMGQIFLGVLLSVLAIPVGVYLAVQCLTAMKDFTGMAKASRQYEIRVTENMGVDDIAEELHSHGIIEMPSFFKTYIKFADEEKGFLNGDFTVNANMSYKDIINTLKTHKTYTETVTVMIPEGMSAEQIALLLEEKKVCRAAEFLAYCSEWHNAFDFEEQIPTENNKFILQEGYLFPDTYEFYLIDDLYEETNTNTAYYAKVAADKMFRNFDSKITKSMNKRMEEIGMSLDEVITLASMIQREATTEESMKMVSSVFQNRLASPELFPTLQSDTTEDYINKYILPNIKGQESKFEDVLEAYDSYTHKGLIGGAICNPGLDAINAVLYPEETDYYYFLASSDGVFYYGRTIEEHEQNIIDAALREDSE